MSLFSHWSGDDAWSSQPASNTFSSQTACLSFLIAAATSRLRTYNYGEVGILGTQIEIAGFGAASVVLKGKLRDGTVVAVKVDKGSFQPLVRKDPTHFESYLGRLALEVRILTNERVKQNINVINILGFGEDKSGGEPSFFLVEEYSTLGDLKAFLRSSPSLSMHQRLGFCLDIAEALEVLHSLKVCHGDVKLENALVFHTNDQRVWLVKLSDFSHAIVASESDPEGPVSLGFGTPLLRAPEIYNGSISREHWFDIGAATRTDTFSYGLFLWEVFKFGASYFDDSWLACPVQSYSVNDVEAKEAFLTTLSYDKFWELVEAFLDGCGDLDNVSLKIVRLVLKETLHYEPTKRCHIGHVAEVLRQVGQSVNKPPTIDGHRRIQSCEGHVQIFDIKSHRSFLDILETNIETELAAKDFARSLQQQVVSDLQRLACMPGQASASHANASMAVSECYTAGYGVDHDMKSMLSWLHQAASAGSAKAVAWYSRVCSTVSLSPFHLENAATYEECENKLSGIPVEDYLYARIQHLELARRTEARLKLDDLLLGEIYLKQYIMDLATFHYLQIDSLGAVHVAAWLGLDSVIKEIVAAPSQVNLTSKLGRTPVFYACLGGNLSTLCSLINSGGDVDQRDHLGIAPLHLCVFFSRNAVEDAVSLLVEHGADTNAVMHGELDWEEHDIWLYGTPIEWAIRCRHSQLVESLLNTAAEITGLGAAIGLFFWEIVDLLLPQKEWRDEDPTELLLSAIHRPYGHWISQGKDHLQCVSWTLNVFEKHGLDLVHDRQVAAYWGRTPLIQMIDQSRTIGDFEIIRQLVKREENIKFAEKEGGTALHYAIINSKYSENWTEILQNLLTHYNTSELEQNYITESLEGSYIHYAVFNDSLVGARELLKKGVDVNQPTYDVLQQTPLHLCIACDGSPEMMTLLIQNGASTELPGSVISGLESRILGLQRTSNVLDLFLDHSSKESSLHALHVAMNHALVHSDTTRKDTQEVLRHMIARPTAQSYINDKDSGGVTLLHRAAAALDPYLTNLLLEAGADVRISANLEGQDLVPLQIALQNGKLCWEAHVSDSQDTTDLYELSRKAAFDTTCLLLAEHTAHKNGAFEGITPLHLAAYMGIADVVERLIAIPGIDKEAEGSWPGQEGLLTPMQLLAATLVQDALEGNYVGFIWDVDGRSQSATPPNLKCTPQLQTEGCLLHFQDLDDVQIESRAASRECFLPLTLKYSPRLIYDNALNVARSMGYRLLPAEKGRMMDCLPFED